MSSKLSVIVPIYNTESYLERCVNSIINQTYEDLEIILVNDGSNDGSLAICKNYEKVDNRIKVIDKENGGLSSARNAGLDVCTGDYISFVDSDDFLETDIYEKLIADMVTEDASVGCMQIKSVDEETYRQIYVDEIPNEYLGVKSGQWYLEKVCQRKVTESVCSKIFKREVINNERFAIGKLNEDFLFLINALINVDKILLTKHVGYNYSVRSGSISRQGFSKSLKDAVYNTEDFVKNIKDKSSSLYKSACCYCVYQARTSIAVMTKDQFKKNKDFIYYCKDIIKRYFRYTKNSILTRNDRLFCKIFKISPKFAKWFTDIVRK